MTPNKPDLDRIEGLAGRLRELSDDASLFNIPAVNALVTRSREAASDLTALISYARELEGALEPFTELGRIVLAEAPPGAETVGLFASATGERAKVRLDDFRRAAALSRTQK